MTDKLQPHNLATIKLAENSRFTEAAYPLLHDE
jgi:hypothetical protein